MHWMLMPLRRYAEFSGRSRRMEFWMWKLFTFLVGMAFYVVIMIAGGAALMAGGDPGDVMAAGGAIMVVALIYAFFGLAIFIPDLAVTVRRLHDTNRSGWWILAPVVPYVVAILAGLAGVASGSRDGTGAGAIVIVALVCMLAVFALAITLVVFLFLEGTRGPNRFGPDPKAPETNAQVFA
jgi:uncharacterized membrane protein YhaH (DUF805 family)